MLVSQARIEANRRNAQLSTGPKTAEGKDIARANALKHGLCASVVVPEDARLVQGRAREYYHTLRPQNNFQCWLVSEIALLTIRIDRVVRQERRVRDKVAIRAELSWDDDRKLDATLLGGQLGTNPEVVVDQLGRTLHGCEWMISRWSMLAYSADAQGAWTPDQVDLAFDLLGTPREFRKGHKPGVLIDDEGRVIDAGDDPAAVARRQIAELKQRREIASILDEANRALARADLGDDTDRELKLIRRYEGTLHSRLRWCMRQLQEQAPLRATPPNLERAWLGDQEPLPPIEVATPPPIPEPKAEVAAEKPLKPDDHPPFDLTDEECPPLGQAADIPAILKARQQKKLEKADSRRDARRRKLERLRA